MHSIRSVHGIYLVFILFDLILFLFILLQVSYLEDTEIIHDSKSWWGWWICNWNINQLSRFLFAFLPRLIGFSCDLSISSWYWTQNWSKLAGKRENKPKLAMPEDASLITSFLSFRAKHLSMETNSTISFSTGHPLHLARDNRQGWTDRWQSGFKINSRLFLPHLHWPKYQIKWEKMEERKASMIRMNRLVCLLERMSTWQRKKSECWERQTGWFCPWWDLNYCIAIHVHAQWHWLTG